MIDIDKTPKNEKEAEHMVMNMIEGAVVDSFVEQLSGDTISLDDEMLTSFLAVVFKNEKEIEFIKAVGLRKFDDNKEVCLAINDFCAALKDMWETGRTHLRS